jgi:hypothetical protein
VRDPVPGESKDAGCALCGSSWGNYWRVTEGVNRFFCCSLCADAWENAVAKVKERTGWPRVDFLFLDDMRGLEADGRARHGDQEVRFFLAGNDDGTITRFDLV